MARGVALAMDTAGPAEATDAAVAGAAGGGSGVGADGSTTLESAGSPVTAGA
jgi:hypothetical protein